MNAVLTDIHIISIVLNQDHQTFNTVCIRGFMTSIKKWQFLPEEILCNGLIGHQHEILNDLRCRISVIWMNIHREIPIVQFNLGFRKIKINTSALLAFLAKKIRQCLHFFKHLHRIRIYDR